MDSHSPAAPQAADFQGAICNMEPAIVGSIMIAIGFPLSIWGVVKAWNRLARSNSGEWETINDAWNDQRFWVEMHNEHLREKNEAQQ